MFHIYKACLDLTAFRESVKLNFGTHTPDSYVDTIWYAFDVADKHELTKLKKLTLNLGAYVSPDDIGENPETFLRLVAVRILDDLPPLAPAPAKKRRAP
jgi:hypothetical protein